MSKYFKGKSPDFYHVSQINEKESANLPMKEAGNSKGAMRKKIDLLSEYVVICFFLME